MYYGIEFRGVRWTGELFGRRDISLNTRRPQGRETGLFSGGPISFGLLMGKEVSIKEVS